MFVTLLSIYNPTITKAGAVAKDGIARKIGDKNRDNPKRIAVVTAVRPVLPPSDTPEALSTKVVVVEVPRIAPKVVATASATYLLWQIHRQVFQSYQKGQRIKMQIKLR